MKWLRLLSLPILALLFSCREEKPNAPLESLPDEIFKIGYHDSHDYYQKFDPPLEVGPQAQGQFLNPSTFKSSLIFEIDLDNKPRFEIFNKIRFAGSPDSIIYDEFTVRTKIDDAPDNCVFAAEYQLKDSIFVCRDATTGKATYYNRRTGYNCPAAQDSFSRMGYYNYYPTHYRKGDSFVYGEVLFSQQRSDCWYQSREEREHPNGNYTVLTNTFPTDLQDTFYLGGFASMESRYSAELFWIKMTIEGEGFDKKYKFHALAAKPYDHQ